MRMENTQEQSFYHECFDAIRATKEIIKILLIGGYQNGGKQLLAAGLCGSIAYSIIFSDLNAMHYNILIGSGAGIVVGTLGTAFFVSKKITSCIAAAAAAIGFIGYKILNRF